jgi:uncharacterized protein
VSAEPISGSIDRRSSVANLHGRFAWYELTTTDMQAAKAFYAGVVGWGALDASVPGRPYALFTAGTATVGGLMDLPEAERRTGGTPTWIGYVGVDDVDATAARVRQQGGAVHVPPTDVPNISRFAIVTDPQGARLALLKWVNPRQARPAEPSGTGRVGWHELLAADREKASSFYGAVFGWQPGDVDTAEIGTYQLFSAGGETIGGIASKPPMMPAPSWLYYFNVGDVDAAAERVKAGGGQILNDPIDVPGGTAVVQCADPQGATFGLEGKRARTPIGYFERVGSGDRPGPRGRRWSW